MTIVNIEKLGGCKTILLLGRPLDVERVARQLVDNPRNNILYCPNPLDFFEDFPQLVSDIAEEVAETEERTILATQNKEFIDTLLESDLEFMVATIRTDRENPDKYWLRVKSKDDALACRKDFDMELRL